MKKFFILIAILFGFLWHAHHASAADFQLVSNKITDTTATIKIKVLNEKIKELHLSVVPKISLDPPILGDVSGMGTVINGFYQETFRGLTKGHSYDISIVDYSTGSATVTRIGTFTTKKSASTNPPRAQTPTPAPQKATHKNITATPGITAATIHGDFSAPPYVQGQLYSIYKVVFTFSDNSSYQNATKSTVYPDYNSSTVRYDYVAAFEKLKPKTTYYVKVEVFDRDTLQFEAPPQSFTTKEGVVAEASGDVGSSLNPDRYQGGYQFLAPGLFADKNGKPLLGIPSPKECGEARDMQAQGFITDDELPRFCDFGNFIGVVIELAIALAAVFLVIKLIAAGFQYMISSIPKVKMEQKLKIFDSIVGIILALTAYIILNTINPQLVRGGVNLERVVLTVDNDENELPVIDQGTVIISSGSIATCRQGVEKMTSPGGNFFYVCKSISKKFSEMISKAWADGIKLGGGGFRTREEQIALRKTNCGKSDYDVFEKPSDNCKPPTARPGHSMHESGLAIDFRCEGGPINNKNNKCFLWLQEHAKDYGLKNFKKEPWHWSVNGR